MINLSFHSVTALPAIPVEGGIYFNSTTKQISLAQASGAWEHYGNIWNATWSDNKLSIFKTGDTTTASIVLDFSDVASAENVSTILSSLRDDINAINTTIGTKATDSKAATGLYKEIADVQTAASGKVASVSNASGDKTLTIAGATTTPTIKVNIDSSTNNALSSGDNGVYVPTYTLKKKGTAESGYVATYEFLKVSRDGTETKVGESINFSKDLVIKSGEVRTLTATEIANGKGVADKKYMVITLSNDDILYINANDLVDVYSQGNGISISNNTVSVRLQQTDNLLSVNANGELYLNSVGGNNVTTTNAVQVLGGPLADDVADNWPSSWKDASGNPLIPPGLSLEQILTGLFFQVKWGTLTGPTYSWNPTLTNKPTASLDKTSYQLVGTTVTLTFAKSDGVSGKAATATVGVTDGYGYSLDGTNITAGTSKSFSSTDGTVSGTLAATGTWKAGSASAVSVTTGATKAIVEGTNTLTVSQSGYTITPGTFTTANVYNVSNDNKIDTNNKVTVSQTGFQGSSAYASSKTIAATTNTASVTGYYPYYSGLLTAPITTFNESAIKKGATRTIPTTLTTATDSMGYFIAVPEGSTYASKSKLTIKNTAETSQFGVAMAQDGTVEVTVAGSAKKNYKVFYFTNAAAWGRADTFGKFIWS